MEDFRGTPKSSIDNNSATPGEVSAARFESVEKAERKKLQSLLEEIRKLEKKRPRKPENIKRRSEVLKQLNSQLEEFYATRGFKQGGILKAQTGGYVD